MERSNAYLPKMQGLLHERGLPQDLAYVAMIESGFSSQAVSPASAVGYWQFIQPTANRYGLQTSWWLDERRDFTKSTAAAAHYLGRSLSNFQNWYLTAAAYNMGETRLRSLIEKYDTHSYWALSMQPDFPQETREYIPKLLAAMFITKAPKLYGFDQLNLQSLKPTSTSSFRAVRTSSTSRVTSASVPKCFAGPESRTDARIRAQHGQEPSDSHSERLCRAESRATSANE